MLTQTQVDKRLADERKAIRGAIRIAKKHGWNPVRVWDGEENVPTTTETEMMEATFAVEEATLRFKHAEHKGTHCFCFVMGNSGAECISDASEGEGWDTAMEEVWAFLETLSN